MHAYKNDTQVYYLVRRMGGRRTADKKRHKNFILGSTLVLLFDQKYRKVGMGQFLSELFLKINHMQINKITQNKGSTIY